MDKLHAGRRFRCNAVGSPVWNIRISLAVQLSSEHYRCVRACVRRKKFTQLMYGLANISPS